MMREKKSRRANNDGAIFKLQNGRWAAEIVLGYVHGKLKKKRVQAKTQEQVRKRLQKLKNKIEQGIPIGDERLTVGAFLDRWLVDYVKPSLRRKTAASYEKNVELHLKPGLGHIRLVKLTAPDIQRFMNEKRERGSVRVEPSADGTEAKHKALSPRTVQILRAILRKAIGQAVKWDLIPRNVVTLTDPPKVQRYKATPLTGEQGKAFIAAASGDRLEVLFIVALALGLRLGEALGLRWSDVDFEAKTLRVEQTIQRVNGKFIFGSTKTDKSRRTLHPSDPTLEALRAHRRKQQEERLRVGPEWGDLDLIFTTETGNPIDPSNVRRSFLRVLAAANLPTIRFHDLRHSCATYLAANGISARVAMEQLGHSEIRTTLEIYSHVMPEMKEEAKRAIQNTIGY